MKKEIKDGTIPDPNAMAIDPATGEPIPGVSSGELGAPVGGQEPDAALRSMDVDTSVAQSDANLVKPKGGEI